MVAVAMFSSLAGLLMGLDIGYIAGVKPLGTKFCAVSLLQGLEKRT